MSAFLSRDELKELSGCSHRARVAEWLRQAGYRFEIAADGWPRVLWAAVNAKLNPDTQRTSRKTEPDFSSLYAKTQKAA